MSEFIYGTDEHLAQWLTGEKLVRCKDCSFLIIDRNKREKCAFFNAPMGKDDFCSKGRLRNYAG